MIPAKYEFFFVYAAVLKNKNRADRSYLQQTKMLYYICHVIA